ncbi:MAG: sigma-70 family RNA polymerase sigma factor [Fuerstiella sp.]
MSTEAFESIWLQKLNDPSSRQEAVARIYEAYVEQLLVHIRERMSVKLMGKVDADDVAQSVFRRFCEGRFEIVNREALFALLVKIAVNRTKELNRFHSAEKRNTAIEVSLDASGIREQIHKDARHPAVNVRPNADSIDAAKLEPKANDAFCRTNDDDVFQFDLDTIELLTRGATAEHAAITVELFESFPSDQQEILGMRIEGQGVAEIAETLGCTRRTVSRKLTLIRDQLLLCLSGA